MVVEKVFYLSIGQKKLMPDSTESVCIMRHIFKKWPARLLLPSWPTSRNG